MYAFAGMDEMQRVEGWPRRNGEVVPAEAANHVGPVNDFYGEIRVNAAQEGKWPD